jgi:hypothetical protein
VLTILHKNDVMKKLCLSLGLCMIVGLAVGQQSASTVNSRSSFYFGGGPTFSKFTGDGSDDATLLAGAQVALGMMWRLGNNFSVLPELNVSMEGSKYDVNPEATFRLWYLNLPVVARYKFGPGQSGFFAETGPQLGVLLDAKRKVNNNKTDVSSDYKNVSFSWNVGAGYALNNGLSIGARITPGISDITESNLGEARLLTGAVRLTFAF